MTRLRLALTPVTDWLATRSLREQGLMLMAVVAAILYLSVTQLWQPLLAERRDTTARIAQMDHALLTVASLPAQPAATPDPRPISRILTDTAPDFDLSIRRIDATDGGADLTLDDAAFDGVILWLDALEAQYGLTISNLQVTRRPQPGQVAASVSLKVSP